MEPHLDEAGHQVGDVEIHAPPTHGTAVAPEEPARLGPLQRLVGVLFSPGETFTDINRKPTWLIATIIAIIFGIAGSVAFEMRTQPDWKGMIERAMRAQADRSGGQMPPQNIIDVQARVQRYFFMFSPVFKPVKYLIIAGCLALGMLLMQTATTFKRILSVVAWTDAGTEIVDRIVKTASLMVRDAESLKGLDPSKPWTVSATNLAAFLPESSTFITILFASIEVFVIWFLILLTMGLVKISGSKKFTTGKAGFLVFGLYVVVVVISAGAAAMFSPS